MSKEIFIGRKQEQAQFRQILQQYHQSRIEKWTPTFFKLLGSAVSLPEKPSILLLYGEGGMGKTTLTRRLEQIASCTPFAEKEKRKDLFQTLFLDWEHYKTEPGLSVGHDQIQPEAVLEILHREIAAKFSEIKTYTEKVKTLKDLEGEVDAKLKEKLAETDETLKKELLDLGSKGIAWVVRTIAATQTGPVAAALSGAPLEPATRLGLQLSAEGISQARQLLQQFLTPDEQELYARPHMQLAQALGEGIAEFAKRQPLVLFLDTYEIVDRQECDEALRKVIHFSGGNTVWVITGRANLADSGQRGNDYFRGYRSEFSEQVYASELREFGVEEIQEFFQGKVLDRLLSEEQAKALSKFSLGIPFVINLAAEVWQKGGVPFEAIIAPPEIGALRRHNAHYQVIRAMSERFLVHCLNLPEDKQAIYALAMMRRPEANLLKAMLDVPDLEPKLQALQQRYSFIWAEDRRLDDKLTKFLGEYLLESIRRADSMVQTLNQRALTWLELQREQMTREISDRADWLADESIAELLLDEVHHRFWQDDGTEDRCGWRALIPWLVEGWMYDRAWANRLLEVAASFQPGFSSEQENRWLKLFREGLVTKPEPEQVQALLQELAIFENRGWLKGLGETDRQAILKIQQGNLQVSLERYEQALTIFLDAEKILPKQARQLRRLLSKTLNNLGVKLGRKNQDVLASNMAKQAFETAIRLHESDALGWLGMGYTHFTWNAYEEAKTALEKAIELDPNNAFAHRLLGNVYRHLKTYDDAKAALEKAIELDPNNAFAHRLLGNVYHDLKTYDDAKAAYEKAIEIDPKYVYAYDNLGDVYRDLKAYDDAKAAYEKVIEIDPKYVHAYDNLGDVYRDLKAYDDAKAAYEKAIEIDPNFVSAYNGLGLLYCDLKAYDDAKAAYEKAIEIDPNFVSAYNGLGLLYCDLKAYDDAKAAYEKAIEVDPKFVHAYDNLGDVYKAEGFYEDAIGAYRQAVQIKPDWVTPLESLGSVYWLQGLYQEGAELYEQAIALLPSSSNFNCVGWLYVVLKRYKQAETALLKALDLDENWAVLFNLGLLYVLKGDAETARIHLQKGLSLCQAEDEWTQTAQTFYNLALGHTEAGLAELQALIERDLVPLEFRKMLLIVAQVMQECPEPILGADKAAEMLARSLK
jgi:tetratricopeptide (TPR) repeat protein